MFGDRRRMRRRMRKIQRDDLEFALLIWELDRNLHNMEETQVWLDKLIAKKRAELPRIAELLDRASETL